jgi:hypothetical protein
MDTVPNSIIDRMFSHTLACWCSFTGVPGKEGGPVMLKLGDRRVWSLMVEIFNKVCHVTDPHDLTVSILTLFKLIK